MKRSTFIIFIFCALFALTACSHRVDHEGRTPLVEVNGAYLYMEDIQAAIPQRLTSADSCAWVEHYIHHWIEDQLLWQKAERNVRTTSHIERMVEEYRKTLILQKYETQLIEQKLEDETAEDEYLTFYNAHKELFELKAPAIRGLFIKVPVNVGGLESLKKWYKKNDMESIEKTEKYCLQNAVIYDYFQNHWILLSDLEGKISTDLAQIEKMLDKQQNFEFEDEEFCCLLHIENYIPTGSTKPYELVRGEIAGLLVNSRKTGFMQQVRNELYSKADERGHIHWFNKKNKRIK